MKPFIFQINTNNTSIGSTSDNQFKIPIILSGSYNFSVEWGDGTKSEDITMFNYVKNTSIATHTYSVSGIYTLTITGYYSGWAFNNTGDRLKLLDIKQWGDCFRLGTTEGGYFYGCQNMNISATDSPDLSLTKSLSSCFRECFIMNSPNLSGWDTSKVTDMSYMFQNAKIFNQDIGSWNVSKVTDMNNMFNSSSFFNNGGSNSIHFWSAPLCTNFSSMFRNAISFNQPIPNLVNTSGVSSCKLTGMFYGATVFNQNIGSWNVSKVTSMGSMFSNAISFNNGGSNSIHSWSAPLCISFYNMFKDALSFNQSMPNLIAHKSPNI